MNDVLKPYLVGTMARGIMWALAGLAAWLKIPMCSDQTVNDLAGYVTATILAGVSMAWSWFKNRKLLQTTPPAQ